jgi:hypothetical protein
MTLANRGIDRDPAKEVVPEVVTLACSSQEGGRPLESPAARQEKLPNYPVIAVVGFLAAGVSFAWWSGSNISQLFANEQIRRGQ